METVREVNVAKRERSYRKDYYSSVYDDSPDDLLRKFRDIPSELRYSFKYTGSRKPSAFVSQIRW